jgi:hypothetical protein
MIIDFGGTPANILKGKAIDFEKIKQESIFILDPFDLSREERTISLEDGKRKIKFPVDMDKLSVDISSEFCCAPDYNKTKELLESSLEKLILGPEIKKKLIEEILPVLSNSNNLREFMEGLVKLIYPRAKFVRLEEVLARNSDKIKKILAKVDIPIRVICPECKRFTNLTLPKGEICKKCNKKISTEEIISSGDYIPQKGFLAILTSLGGYKTFSKSEEKKLQIKEINKSLGINLDPLFFNEIFKLDVNPFKIFIEKIKEEIYLNEQKLEKQGEKKWKQ